MAQSPNQRKHPRVSTELAAQGKPVRKLQLFEATIRNLSAGGVYLSTSQKLYSGQEILLAFHIESNGRKKNCMVQAKVVWIHTDRFKSTLGYGMEFQDCSVGMRQLFHDFVDFNLGKKMDVQVQLKGTNRGQLRG